MCGAVAMWTTLADERDLLVARITASHFDYHLHDTYTIGVMRSGHAKFMIRDCHYQASPGDIFIIHPYEVHNVDCGDDTIEYDVLYPSVALMADAISVGQNQHMGDIPRFGPTVLQNADMTEQLVAAVEAYLERQPEAATHHHLENAFASVFGPGSKVDQETPISVQHARAVRQAIELMQEFFIHPFDLNTIAEKVGLSKFHFSRVFTKTTGMTPGAFFRQIKLAAARDLICQHRPLADVAHKVGFADQAHLTRIFKKTYGITPGQFANALN